MCITYYINILGHVLSVYISTEFKNPKRKPLKEICKSKLKEVSSILFDFSCLDLNWQLSFFFVYNPAIFENINFIITRTRYCLHFSYLFRHGSDFTVAWGSAEDYLAQVLKVRCKIKVVTRLYLNKISDVTTFFYRNRLCDFQTSAFRGRISYHVDDTKIVFDVYSFFNNKIIRGLNKIVFFVTGVYFLQQSTHSHQKGRMSAVNSVILVFLHYTHHVPLSIFISLLIFSAIIITTA